MNQGFKIAEGHMPVRTKFATQIDPEILERTRALAAKEGRQIQSLVEEALTDLLAKRASPRSGMSFDDAQKHSIERFSTVYERLAK